MRKITTLLIASLLSSPAIIPIAANAASEVASENTKMVDQDCNCCNKKPPRPEDRHMKGPGEPMFGMFKDLNLTDEQKEKISSLMKAQFEKDKASHAPAPKDGMKDRFNAVATDNFDEAAVRKNAEEMAKQFVDREVDKAKTFNQIYLLLTPEQKKIVAEKHAKRQQEMKEHFASKQNQTPPEGGPMDDAELN